jgi:magnesium and cobalt transporter
MNDIPPSGGSAPKSWLERLSQAFSGEPRNREELIEELRNAKENGLLDGETLEMLEGTLNMSSKQAVDVMVPRAKVISISADANLDEAVAIVLESGHSRYPIHGDTEDKIVGMLLAKDLLKAMSSSARSFKLLELMRPIHLIPESKKLNVLLREFKSGRRHMAIVVDEYGGVAGLVTIEDVLEEIVGEIDDEHDAEDKVEQRIHVQADGSFLVQALTPLEEFNSRFETAFDETQTDTIGGIVVEALGHLPERGEAVELAGLRFEVAKADDRRLLSLRVRVAE